MDERKRLAYLKAMGIESWVFQSSEISLDPDDTFVNAPGLVPEEKAVKSAKNPLDKGVLPPGALTEGRNEARECVRSYSGSGQISAPESSIDIENNKVSEKSINPENEIPVFAFASFCVSDNILILLDLADPDSPGLSSSEIALLDSILFAIKKASVDDQAYDKEIFSWPSLVGAHQDKGSMAAKEALKSYINGKVNRYGIRNVLVLGNKVIENMDKFLLEGAAVQVTATFSLSEMLQNPELKSSVWKNIKQFLKT